MTIPNDKRLAFLRQTAATQSRAYIEVERSEFISILDELIEKRANPVVELRADRVRLQGENEALHAEIRALTNQELSPEYIKALERYTGKPTDIEALAQRLAKVEDRLAAGDESVNANADALSDVIDVVEIALAHSEKVAARLDEFETRVVGLLDAHTTDIAALKHPDVPFSTGAATTVEEVIAQAEEPSAESDDAPRRGDRVRLEGVRSIGNTKLEDGWYDVTGSTALDEFQVKAGIGRFWVSASDTGLKEVRRGAAKLPE